MSQQPNKIECLCCGSTKQCFMEEFDAVNKLNSYMCINCGFMSADTFKPDTDYYSQLIATFPNLIKDLAKIDTARGIVWFPCVINIPTKGMIFPEGKSIEDWGWTYAPVVVVTEEEKEKYPDPNNPGTFFEKRLAIDQSIRYGRLEFEEAAKKLGLVIDEKQLTSGINEQSEAIN